MAKLSMPEREWRKDSNTKHKRRWLSAAQHSQLQRQLQERRWESWDGSGRNKLRFIFDWTMKQAGLVPDISRHLSPSDGRVHVCDR